MHELAVIMTMPFRIISFEKVKKYVQQLFEVDTNDFHLTPSSLAGLLENRASIDWRTVPKWESFESGSKDISSVELLNVLYKTKPFTEPLIIITDDTFKTQQAYLINYSDLVHFCDQIYPRLQQAEFAQPLDLILLSPEEGLLTMLHHEGKYSQIQAPYRHQRTNR